MNVLSLFDGISCGKVALSRSGHLVESYHASEIDPFAIQVSSTRHKRIRQLGTVTGLSKRLLKYILPTFDLLMGGSPCQGFSVAGKGLNFKDPRSALLFEYVRVLEILLDLNPDLKFLLENVYMKKEWQDIISKLLGVEPIIINSNLVSAQNRKRLYWTNIEGVQQPEDRKIFLDSVLLPDTYPVCLTEVRTDKSKAIRRIHQKLGRDFSPRRGKDLVARTDKKANCLTATFSSKEHMVLQKLPCIRSHDRLIYKPEKSQCLDANYHKGADNHGQRTGYVLVPPDLIGLAPGDPIPIELSAWRKLDPIECERLQGLPDNYTAGVSNAQRYKQLGNGWQVDTISHIFDYL